VITPMDQLLLVGRKRGAQDVLVALQHLGVVQVDPIDPAHLGLGVGLDRFQTSDALRAERSSWDRIALRATALLAALDVRDEVPAAAKTDLPLTPEDVAERVELVGGLVDSLVGERESLGEEIALIKTTLPIFRDVAATLGQLEASRYLHGAATIVASSALPEVRAALREAVGGRIAFEERPRGSKQVVLLLATHRSDAAVLRAALARVGLAELTLPERYRDLGVAKATHVMEERLAQHPKRLTAIGEELRKLALQHGPRLKAFAQMALNHRERLDRLGDLAEGRFSFALRGWVPSVDRPRVVEALTKQFAQDLVVQHRPADEHHDEGVPVRLENPGWARPFQGLLSLFAPPKYGNFDPTWTLAVFFPLFFGVIVGDIGFGLLFALLATALRVRGQRGKALSLGPLDMVIPAPALAPISTVMFWAAGWTIVWGYVYGEFFGTFLEYWPKAKPIFFTQLHGSSNGWIEILLFRVEVFDPVIMIALAFGTLQILGGWVIRVIYGIRHHDMKHVYEGIGMFTGVASLVLFATAFLTDNLNPVLNGVVGVGFVVFLICVVLAKMPLMVIELVSNGGNILSYLRLFAVGLAAALVAKLATQLGFAVSDSLPVIGPVLGILVGLFVHLLALVLKVIGYTLQPLRLQYVEFYTKFGFYEAAGRPYQPFKTLGGKS
jgi:V/A-type H+/Na+-transporting ATPase subunit I